MGPLDADAVAAYLERIGLEPGAIRPAERDLETLTRLQIAHVKHVPFENLSIIGDPFEDGAGPGVTLEIDALYEKIVERGRGGYCYELNGLFTSLLDALGFDVHRAAAMVIPDDGEHSTPANHHVAIVSLDRAYVVDVGMGKPQMRRPTPLDGEATRQDGAGVAWRVVETDRPMYDHRVEYRIGDGDWVARYDFDQTPRGLSYFQATCDYLSTAPESPFTGTTVVGLELDDGSIEMGRGTLTRMEGGEETEREISRAEWYDLLESEFGLSMPE